MKGCERSLMVKILKIQIENKPNPDYAMCGKKYMEN